MIIKNNYKLKTEKIYIYKLKSNKKILKIFEGKILVCFLKKIYLIKTYDMIY